MHQAGYRGAGIRSKDQERSTVLGFEFVCKAMRSDGIRDGINSLKHHPESSRIKQSRLKSTDTPSAFNRSEGISCNPKSIAELLDQLC